MLSGDTFGAPEKALANAYHHVFRIYNLDPKMANTYEFAFSGALSCKMKKVVPLIRGNWVYHSGNQVSNSGNRVPYSANS